VAAVATVLRAAACLRAAVAATVLPVAGCLPAAAAAVATDRPAVGCLPAAAATVRPAAVGLPAADIRRVVVAAATVADA
jgi:hypothetical protein